MENGNALPSLGARLFAKSTVGEIYRGIFNRRPDEATLAHWSSVLRRNKPPLHQVISELSALMMVDELYHGIFNRAPDAGGKEHWRKAMVGGKPLREVLRLMLASEEFRGVRKAGTIKQSDLPAITGVLPRPIETVNGLDNKVHHVFRAENDSDFELLERLIVEHRFYDSFGGWGYAIDLDKQVTAAIARGLGAGRCLDIGCSNGPVLSVLARQGVDVTGIDLSHLAFAIALPDIRDRMRYGDLLSLDFEGTFDVVLAMDFFEHLSPFQVEKHIERAAALVGRDGFLFVNSPMYGTDRVFGTPFPLHLEAWRHESQTSFWRNIPCDAKGWPWDGHLIWAAVPYWEELFTSRGLVRDVEIETAIQKVLSGFFAEYAPPRKAIFVLKWPENERRSAEVSDRLTALVSAVEGLHQPR